MWVARDVRWTGRACPAVGGWSVLLAAAGGAPGARRPAGSRRDAPEGKGRGSKLAAPVRSNSSGDRANAHASAPEFRPLPLLHSQQPERPGSGCTCLGDVPSLHHGAELKGAGGRPCFQASCSYPPPFVLLPLHPPPPSSSLPPTPCPTTSSLDGLLLPSACGFRNQNGEGRSDVDLRALPGAQERRQRRAQAALVHAQDVGGDRRRHPRPVLRRLRERPVHHVGGLGADRLPRGLRSRGQSIALLWSFSVCRTLS